MPTDEKLTPEPSAQGETACGGRIELTPQTPYVLWREKIMYFCNADCKELYEKDPLNSCMAARLLVGR